MRTADLYLVILAVRSRANLSSSLTSEEKIYLTIVAFDSQTRCGGRFIECVGSGVGIRAGINPAV
ncbi:MAG: hypothetical protein LBQ68_09375 [Clostridiales bacterium]|nr:hypothetical protein [Clostridiales bacterium]